MKKFLLFILALTITVGASAQSYDKAIGLRFGYDNAITYKMNLSSANSLDFALAFPGFFHAVVVQGFYLWNFPIVDNLNFHVGPGATIGAAFAGYFLVSANVEFGIEYKIPTAPIAISLDYTPGIGIFGGTFAPSYYGGGLGIKYTF